jgi:hypothetical protein
VVRGITGHGPNISHCLAIFRDCEWIFTQKWPGVVVYTYNSSYSGGRDRRTENPRPVWAKIVGPHLKNKVKTQGGGSDSGG